MPYDMGDAIGYIKLNIKNFEENYKKVHDDTEQLDMIAGDLGSVFDKAAKLVVAAFTAISAAAAGALKSVIDVGSTFEASMSQVAATMGITADEIANNSEEYRRLSDAAKAMGESTKFSADEAAQGLQFLALAGYSVDEAISTLPTILDLAAAGGMDLAQASDMVTDAMSALSLPLEEATSFTDKLARTAQRSNTSVAQLGEAILQIGGTAKSLAGGVDELDTALGILANNGIKAAEGGTALRQIILNLTAPSEKAAKYMEEIGFSAYDAAGNMKPLNETFAELSEIVNSANTQLEKDEIITNIFDARQLKSARALLAGYGDSWNDLFNEIQNADGAASQMAQTMQENLQGAMTIAKSAIEGVQVTAYEALENGLTKSVKAATGSISELNNTLKSPEMQKSLQKIGDMLGDILTKFADFAANIAIPKLIEWFSRLDELADNLKAALAGLATAIGVVGTALIACNGGLINFVSNTVIAKSTVLTFLNTLSAAHPILTAVGLALGALVGYMVSVENAAKRQSEAFIEANTAYKEEYEAVMDLVSAYDEAKKVYEDTAHKNDEQIQTVNTLIERLKEYADKTHLTATELAAAEDIISQLNAIYPTNISLVDGIVTGYDEAARSLELYNKQLEAQALLEAERNLLQESAVTKNSAYEYWQNTEQAAVDTAAAYQEALRKLEKYQKGANNFTAEDKRLAEEHGMTVKQWLKADYEAKKESWENATLANSKAREAYQEAAKDLEDGENKLLKLRIDAGEKIEGIYSDQQTAQIELAKKSAMASLQGQIEAVETEATELAEKKEQMWADLDELDRKWQLRQIGSEDEYQQKRKEILLSAQDEYDDNWVKEYNKSLVYQEQADEKAKKESETRLKEQQEIQEKQLQSQIKALEDRAKIDGTYTQEMLIADKEALISGLDKSSEIYQKYNEEIKDDKIQLQIDLANENKRIAENEFNTWQNSYNSLVSEAENAYKQIQSDQATLTNSLTKNIQLYDTESKKVWDKQSRSFQTEDVMKVNAESIKQQAEETENYIKLLEKLQDKIPDSLMSEIYAMDREEGQKFVEQLNDLSASELKAYTDNYNKIYEETKEFTDKLYSEQLTDFKKEYADKFNTIFENVPNNLKLVGRDSIYGFVKGIEEKSSEATGALQELFAGENGVLAKTKEALDIHSPSGKFEEIGVDSYDGFFNGLKSKIQTIAELFKSLGQTAGESFTSSFQSAWDSFAANFQSGLSGLGFASQFATPSGLQIPQGYFNSMFSGSNNQQMPQNISYQNNYDGNKLTKQDITNAIKQAMPDGDVILQVDGQQFGLISRKQLNAIASQSGNLNLKN